MYMASSTTTTSVILVSGSTEQKSIYFFSKAKEIEKDILTNRETGTNNSFNNKEVTTINPDTQVQIPTNQTLLQTLNKSNLSEDSQSGQ